MGWGSWREVVLLPSHLPGPVGDPLAAPAGSPLWGSPGLCLPRAASVSRRQRSAGPRCPLRTLEPLLSLQAAQVAAWSLPEASAPLTSTCGSKGQGR